MSVEIAKPFPANLEAERAVLGGGMLNANALLTSLAFLREEDFSIPENRLIFRRFQSLTARGEAVDLLTLTHELKTLGELERAGGAGYLSSLLDGVPRVTRGVLQQDRTRTSKAARVDSFRARVQDLVWGDSKIKRNSELSADAIASFAVDSALHIAAGEDSPIVVRSWADVADSAFRELESAHDHPESVRRFRCGISSVDEMTGCLRPKELAVIVAPTSNGKRSSPLKLPCSVIATASRCSISARRCQPSRLSKERSHFRQT